MVVAQFTTTQEDEVTYSVIAKTEDMGTKDVAEVYSRIYAAINEALRLMGIAADYSPGNVKNCPNLTVNGKKISGSAQANKSGIVLQHGTLLLNVDLPRMFTLLRVPWANTCMQVVDVAKNKITSVQNELGHAVKPETAVNAIAHGFKVALNIQIAEGELTREERELAEKLYKEKYCTEEWNFNGKSQFRLRFLAFPPYTLRCILNYDAHGFQLLPDCVGGFPVLGFSGFFTFLD